MMNCLKKKSMVRIQTKILKLLFLFVNIKLASLQNISSLLKHLITEIMCNFRKKMPCWLSLVSFLSVSLLAILVHFGLKLLRLSKYLRYCYFASITSWNNTISVMWLISSVEKVRSLKNMNFFERQVHWKGILPTYLCNLKCKSMLAAFDPWNFLM